MDKEPDSPGTPDGRVYLSPAKIVLVHKNGDSASPAEMVLLNGERHRHIKQILIAVGDVVKLQNGPPASLYDLNGVEITNFAELKDSDRYIVCGPDEEVDLRTEYKTRRGLMGLPESSPGGPGGKTATSIRKKSPERPATAPQAGVPTSPKISAQGSEAAPLSPKATPQSPMAGMSQAKSQSKRVVSAGSMKAKEIYSPSTYVPGQSPSVTAKTPRRSSSMSSTGEADTYLEKYGVQAKKAKILLVFSNGNKYDEPVQMVLNDKSFKSYNQMMEKFTKATKIGTGPVRKVYSLRGEVMETFDDFEDKAYYIACGGEPPIFDCAYKFPKRNPDAEKQMLREVTARMRIDRRSSIEKMDVEVAADPAIASPMSSKKVHHQKSVSNVLEMESAETKLIHVFRNKNKFDGPVPILLNSSMQQNYDTILQRVNDECPLTSGPVRRIHLLKDGRLMTQYDEFEDDKYYIATFGDSPELDFPYKMPKPPAQDPAFKDCEDANVVRRESLINQLKGKDMGEAQKVERKNSMKAGPVVKNQNITKFGVQAEKAKVVYIFNNGNKYDISTRVTLNPRTIKLPEHLFKFLNEKITLVTGPVRKIYDFHGNALTRLEEFADSHFYIACSGDKPDFQCSYNFGGFDPPEYDPKKAEERTLGEAPSSWKNDLRYEFRQHNRPPSPQNRTPVQYPGRKPRGSSPGPEQKEAPKTPVKVNITPKRPGSPASRASEPRSPQSPASAALSAQLKNLTYKPKPSTARGTSPVRGRSPVRPSSASMDRQMRGSSPATSMTSSSVQKFGTQASKAKVLTVFENGNAFKAPTAVTLNVRTIRNFDHVITQFNQQMKTTPGYIHKVFDMKGNRMQSYEDFEDGDFYIACGTEPVDYSKPYTSAPENPVIQRRGSSPQRRSSSPFQHQPSESARRPSTPSRGSSPAPGAAPSSARRESGSRGTSPARGTSPSRRGSSPSRGPRASVDASAKPKTIYVYRNNKKNEAPTLLLVNDKLIRSIAMLHGRVQERLQLAKGPVRHLYTMRGKEIISLGDLVDGESYIACGLEKLVTNIAYEPREKTFRERMAERAKSFSAEDSVGDLHFSEPQ